MYKHLRQFDIINFENRSQISIYDSLIFNKFSKNFLVFLNSRKKNLIVLNSVPLKGSALLSTKRVLGVIDENESSYLGQKLAHGYLLKQFLLYKRKLVFANQRRKIFSFFGLSNVKNKYFNVRLRRGKRFEKGHLVFSLGRAFFVTGYRASIIPFRVRFGAFSCFERFYSEFFKVKSFFYGVFNLINPLGLIRMKPGIKMVFFKRFFYYSFFFKKYLKYFSRRLKKLLVQRYFFFHRFKFIKFCNRFSMFFLNFIKHSRRLFSENQIFSFFGYSISKLKDFKKISKFFFFRFVLFNLSMYKLSISVYLRFLRGISNKVFYLRFLIGNYYYFNALSIPLVNFNGFFINIISPDYNMRLLTNYKPMAFSNFIRRVMSVKSIYTGSFLLNFSNFFGSFYSKSRNVTHDFWRKFKYYDKDVGMKLFSWKLKFFRKIFKLSKFDESVLYGLGFWRRVLEFGNVADVSKLHKLSIFKSFRKGFHRKRYYGKPFFNRGGFNNRNNFVRGKFFRSFNDKKFIGNFNKKAIYYGADNKNFFVKRNNLENRAFPNKMNNSYDYDRKHFINKPYERNNGGKFDNVPRNNFYNKDKKHFVNFHKHHLKK